MGGRGPDLERDPLQRWWDVRPVPHLHVLEGDAALRRGAGYVGRGTEGERQLSMGSPIISAVNHEMSVGTAINMTQSLLASNRPTT